MEKITYNGWDCVRLANGSAELVVTTSIGPRIIHYGLAGGPNAFHVLPELMKDPNAGGWEPYGGHRLWIAPEVKALTYYPDNDPIGEAVMEGETLRVSNPPESTTGIAKTMYITLAREGSAVKVRHVLENRNVWAVTCAPWALSIVALGGRVVIPQEPYAGHPAALLPARTVVMWSYTDMADPRWRWGTKYVTLRQDDALAKPQKLGVYNTLGWAAHVTNEQAFICRIQPDPRGPSVLPDYGSNFETYTGGAFQELETVAPLQTIEPGASAEHVEYWYLERAAGIEDTDQSLDTRLLPIVDRARAATEALG